MMKKTPRVPPLSVNLRTLAARHADPLARVSSQASSTMPATSAAGSPRIPITARNVHLKLARGDLVAYEYLIDGKSPQWSWGLGTVVNVRGLRMVQLLPWQAREVTPAEANASAHDKVTTTAGGGGKTGTQATERTTTTTTTAESQAAQQQQQKAQREKELHALEERQRELESEAAALSSQLAVGEVSEHVVRSGLRSQIAQAAATLRHARYELTEVTEKEWRELRSYHSPPAVVELVLSATMVVLNEPNAKSWTGIQRVLRDANFLSRLQKLDPAQLPSQARRRLQIQYLQNPLFTYESAMHGSRALGALQQWVVASVQNNAALAELDERDRDAGSAATSAAHKAKEEQLAEIEARLQRCIVEADKLRLLILQAEIPTTTTTTTKTEDDSSHGQKESQASQPKVRKAGSTPHSATPASARRDTSTASHRTSPPAVASTTATTVTNAAAAKMTEKDWNDFLLQMLQDNENDSSNSAGGGKSAKTKTPTLTPTVAEVMRHARHAWSLPTDNDNDNNKNSNVTRAATVGVVTVLRSSILYNYTMPDALELTLAPRQVEQLVRAVRERSPSAAAEEQAAAQRLQEMQDELHELRAQLAQSRLSPPAGQAITPEDNNNNNRKEEEAEDAQQQGDMQGKAKKPAAALLPPPSSPIHHTAGTDQSTATSEGVVLPAMTRTEATPATGQQGKTTAAVASTSPAAAITDKLSSPGVAAVGPSAMPVALPSPPQSTTRTSHTTDSESWPGVSPRGHSSGRVGEQPVNSSRHSARTTTPRGEQGSINTNVTSAANVPASPPASAAVSRALPDVLRALQEQVVTLRGHAASTGDVLQDLQRTIRTNAQLCAMMESV